MAQEATSSGTSTRIPAQRTGGQESPNDHARTGEHDRTVTPVTFERLLSVAVLTPAQAVLLAVKLIEAARPDGTSNGSASARTHLSGVTLTPEGEVSVDRVGTDAGTPITDMIGQLLESARRLPAHPRPAQLVLLRSLEEAAGDPLRDPGGRARALEAVLVDTGGPDARQVLTGQLAALVGAFAHVAPGVPGGGDTRPDPGPARVVPPAKATAPRRAAPAPPASRPPRRGRVLLRRRTRGRVALVVLVVAAVLTVSGYVALGGAGSDIVGSLGGGKDSPSAPDTTVPDRSADKPAKKPRHHRAQAVPTVAPRQADPITGVVLQKAGSCRPGSLCPVTVTVHFRPSTTDQTIGWKVGTARVCRPGLRWSAPVAVTAQPGWTTVYASSSVRVPKAGGRTALTALTTTPARAQSRPVPVTGSTLTC